MCIFRVHLFFRLKYQHSFYVKKAHMKHDVNFFPFPCLSLFLGLLQKSDPCIEPCADTCESLYESWGKVNMRGWGKGGRLGKPNQTIQRNIITLSCTLSMCKHAWSINEGNFNFAEVLFLILFFLPFKLIRWKLLSNDGYYKMTFWLLLKT